MPKLCQCGKIVADRCDCKRSSTQKRSTTSEGHGYDHRKASERYRANHPLCERCVALYGVEQANPTEDMHHIYAIASNPELRMKRSNWLALCRPCHEQIEGDAVAGLEIKSRSNRYDWLIGGNHG